MPQYVASATLYFGNEILVDLLPQSLPVLGSKFLLEVTAEPTDTMSLLFIHARASSPIATPFGDLLLDPTSARLVTDLEAPLAGLSRHTFPLPNDPGLIGQEGFAQAVRIGPSPALTNGVAIRLGL